MPDPDVLTAEIATAPFSVVGVTWDKTQGVDGVVIRYRVRQSGTWTAWEAVGESDAAPDAGSQESGRTGARGATDPIVAINSTGIQIWAEAERGTVTGLKTVLIDPGNDPDTINSIGVHFYVDGRWAGATTASSPRADVGAVYGHGDNHGYSITLPATTGTHHVCAYAIDTNGGTNPEIACRTVTP